MNNGERILLYIMIAFFSFFIGIIASKHEENKKEDRIINCINEDYECSLYNEAFYYIELYKVKYPYIVSAQYILETGYAQSRLFKENNNCFGMLSPKVRPHCSIHENGEKYAKYTSVESSVIDYKIWQDTYFKGKTEEDYFEFLQRVYAADSLYVDKLKIIINIENEL